MCWHRLQIKWDYNKKIVCEEMQNRCEATGLWEVEALTLVDNRFTDGAEAVSPIRTRHP
jgi:hypothetical protein